MQVDLVPICLVKKWYHIWQFNQRLHAAIYGEIENEFCLSFPHMPTTERYLQCSRAPYSPSRYLVELAMSGSLSTTTSYSSSLVSPFYCVQSSVPACLPPSTDRWVTLCQSVEMRVPPYQLERPTKTLVALVVEQVVDRKLASDIHDLNIIMYKGIRQNCIKWKAPKCKPSAHGDAHLASCCCTWHI